MNGNRGSVCVLKVKMCVFEVYFPPNYGSDFPGGSDGKASAYHAGDMGSILGSGRSPGEGNGKPLQYSCLENHSCLEPSRVHGVAKSRTRLSDFTFTHFPGKRVHISHSTVKPSCDNPLKVLEPADIRRLLSSNGWNIEHTVTLKNFRSADLDNVSECWKAWTWNLSTMFSTIYLCTYSANKFYLHALSLSCVVLPHPNGRKRVARNFRVSRGSDREDTRCCSRAPDRRHWHQAQGASPLFLCLGFSSRTGTLTLPAFVPLWKEDLCTCFFVLIWRVN